MNSDLAKEIAAITGGPVYIVDAPPIAYDSKATTAELLREEEALHWHIAEAEREWGAYSMEARVTMTLVAKELQSITNEIHRRHLASSMPSAPRWPDDEPDKRAEWEEIKRRTDIVDLAERLIGGGQARGGLVWYRCFAHEDNTPSLAVYPNENPHFHCFSCQAHGDVIDLARGAMQLSSFQATLAILGEWAGMNTRTIVIQRGDEAIEVKT